MFNYYYLILVLPAILFALVAQMMVSGSFKKYSKQRCRNGLTGAQAAEAVLRQAGVYGVRVERISGKLTDHFDPKGGVIRLSDDVYGAATVAAVGVAAHEAGHAIQYHQEYAPMKLRAAIIPVTKFGSWLSMPLIILGFVLGVGEGEIGRILAIIGILLFSLVAVFQLVTLPVEFNASSRAMSVLNDSGILARDELSGARKVLSAAAMTYVAALLVSLMQILRFVLILGRNR